ncbi:hypothetical protein [Microcystis phage Mae-JY35]
MTTSPLMDSLEQAREALDAILSRWIDGYGYNTDSEEDHALKERAADALAALSQPQLDAVEGVKGEPVAYVARYGGRCRDCADNDGICPTSGLPCNVEDCNKAISHVIKALTYGIAQGYIDALAAPPVADSEAMRERVDTWWIGRRAGEPTKATRMPRVAEIWREQGVCVIEAHAPAEARLAQAEQGPAVTEAERDVMAERRRQVDAEGWTPAHDDTHADGAMARAAGLYALVSGSDTTTYRNAQHGRHRRDGSPLNDYHAAAMRLWPWDWSWFKPTSRRRDLVKAGALILAEIERLDRAALHSQSAAGEEGKP